MAKKSPSDEKAASASPKRVRKTPVTAVKSASEPKAGADLQAAQPKSAPRVANGKSTRPKKAAAPAAPFAAPAEAQWHLMIAEAAYYRAEKRGFVHGYALEDWLISEQQIKQYISS